MSDNNGIRKRGSSRFEATNARVKKVVELLSPTKGHQEIADGLGISKSSLRQMERGAQKTSRTVDLACEALLRRFGKEREAGAKLVVARVDARHWPTISTVVTGVGGVVEEFSVVVEEKGHEDFVRVVILSVDAQHEPVVSQLVRSTGGEVRRVLP